MERATQILRWTYRGLAWTLRVGVLLVLLASSTPSLHDPQQNVRRFTRALEFNFLDWTLTALQTKLEAFGLGASGYLSAQDRKDLVLEYLRLADQARDLETRLQEAVAAPGGPGAQAEADSLRAELARVRERQQGLSGVAEAVFQEQVAVVLADLSLEAEGQVLPPVAFRFSQVPQALVVSPRHVIRQDANIPIDAALPLDDQIRLEGEVERGLDVSALVVPIGGVGTYPTMVEETGSLSWLAEVVVHEWVHNYLAFRPLGWYYEVSPEARTMNETAASLLGKEIGRRVLERYYPELLPPPPAPTSPEPAPANPPAFDFRAEMRETRVSVDRLLAEGQIEAAEAYMEQRRGFFWDHGYRIRRLNQAYFAFYGAYADEPGGPAGEDPVGDAVRRLWERSVSPADFLRTMARMTGFEDLQAELDRREVNSR